MLALSNHSDVIFDAEAIKRLTLDWMLIACYLGNHMSLSNEVSLKN
jgi:hypothetical protein